MLATGPLKMSSRSNCDVLTTTLRKSAKLRTVVIHMPFLGDGHVWIVLTIRGNV